MAAGFGDSGRRCSCRQANCYAPPAQPTDHTALLVQPNIPVQENWTTDYFQGTLRDLTWISLHPPGRKGGADISI